MGTDIHGVVQQRYEGEKKWRTVGEIDDVRNYRLFAILAGVRNGFGFAGVKTFEPLVPIQEGRGLPDDFIMEGEEHPWHYGDRKTWMGDHSHGWCSLDEFKNWNGWDIVSETGHTIRQNCGIFWKFIEYIDAAHEGEIRLVYGFDS